MTQAGGDKGTSSPQDGLQRPHRDVDDVTYHPEPEGLHIAVSPPPDGFVGTYTPAPDYDVRPAPRADGAAPQLPNVDLSSFKALQGLTPTQALQVIRKAQELRRAAKDRSDGA